MTARIEIAYADHRDNRMIVLGRYGWPSLAEQEAAFTAAPAEEDSDFILDFYDDEGVIAKDKCVSAATVEAVMGVSLKEAIRRGRIREASLTRAMRAHFAEGRA